MNKTILLNFKTMRKCFQCKEFITLEESFDSVIYYKNNFFHEKCLREKLCNKKVGKLCKDDCDNLLNQLREDTINKLENIIYKNHLYKYLMQHYDVVMFPNYIYQKLEKIFIGEYKNMSRNIPPAHLLDMFQRKMEYLDKLYHKEKLDGVARVNYDLAVLIGKYNGYLEFIEREKQEIVETVEFLKKKKINISTISRKENKINNNSDVDLLESDEETQ